MPRARNRFERADQIIQWLQREFPCGRRVVLKWKKTLSEGGTHWDGHTVRNGRRLEIYLSERRNRTWAAMIDTLLHEYAHALLWGVAATETDDESKHHPPAFWAQFGELSDRWHHDGGAEQAREYEIR